MTDDPEEVERQSPPRSAPRFVCFQGTDGVEKTYFIYVEQQVLCQMRSFKMAFVVWFIAHYVFNLEYSKHMKEVATFVQEFIFGLPNKVKRSATYLTVSSDIQSFLP